MNAGGKVQNGALLKAIRIIGMPLLAGVVMFLAYAYLYIPIKFRYLTHRVESAETTEQERKAFKMAADWGRLWDVDRLSRADAEKLGFRLEGTWLLRIEWLESSGWSGRPYAASREVLDTNNL